MSLADKRVLITGGCGFIGSRLAKRLAPGCDILSYDLLHPQIHGLGATVANVDFDGIVVQGDVSNYDKLATTVRYFNPEIIYHLAAETGTGQSYDEPVRCNDVNIMGTANLVEAVRAHGKSVETIVLAGSRAVYGEGAGETASKQTVCAAPRMPENMRQGDFDIYTDDGDKLHPVATPESLPPLPASIYASTKLMQEYILTQCFADSPINIVNLRFQNVYGPGQSLSNPYTGVISIFTEQILAGRRLNIYEDGDIIRDFVYVDDVITSLVQAAAVANIDPAPINIGSGRETSIIGMAQALLSKLGRDPNHLDITGDFRVGDVRYAVGDVRRAKDKLDWSSKVDFDTGLAHFVEWATNS